MKRSNAKQNIPFLKFVKLIPIQLLLLLLSTSLFAQHGQEIEVEGYISEVGIDYLVVQDYSFIVDENTEIVDEDDIPLLFSSLSVGMLVEVEGYLNNDGSYIAHTIEVEDDSLGGDDFEITGFVEAIDSISFSINGFPFIVDANTVFETESGLSFSFSQIEVGMLLEVEAELLPGGELLALEVELEDDHNSGEEVELTARIDSITTNSIIIGNWEFFVNEQTEIKGDDDQILTLSDLAVNSLVEVEAFKQPDETFLAVKIEVEDDHENEIEFTAWIESIEGSSITLLGITFLTDSNTVFLNNNRMQVSIGALAVGMLVEVEGIKLNDGTYYAEEVKIEDFYSDEIEVEGIISELSNSYLIVNDIQFEVDSTTEILDDQDNVIPFSALTVGQLVEVEGIRTENGSILASKIEIENENDIEIFGKITAVNSDNLELNGLTIYVTENTIYLNQNNQPITFGDLSVNLLVEVDLTIGLNNVLTAEKVKIEDGPDFSKINGSIGAVSGIEIQVAQASYSISSETIILDKNFNKISISQLNTGEKVTVWAQSNGSNRSAFQVQSSIGGVTAVDDNAIVAANFELEQNYPNPFNPTTTISFTIFSDELVTLKVFNAIGQEVATLLNNKLGSGSYNVSFDAAGLSSGIYLYRLESGSQLQVKKMMLLK
ncbi:MAG: T9SS type A sorting domain-containing protein [Ignavibacteriae bacterium]|jgi:hypothetical protein|nr:T9SS C-terminal target domain-containing protein [Ignavibacteriota bacterium]NOH00084.1 T9SS type A sorting domain-containing protein [Ignavibacteriota bacterium]